MPLLSYSEQSWDKFPTKYDREICKASKQYLPVPTSLFGCTLWKAQLYQESLLDPNARSPAGAEGIAQFMPRTWEDTLRSMGLGWAERTNASVAIQAGAYYMMTLRNKWVSERAEKERMQLAQASYNAGFGNIYRAQKLCNMEASWDRIKECLSRVTGRHSKETIIYVDRIWRYWKQWSIG